VEPISEEIEVGGEIAGRLTAMLVDEGAIVTRGQVLARLDSEDEAARARLDEARERANAIDSAARDDERERADAAVRLAQARLEEANAIFEKTVIRAPIDGTVLRRYKEAGESVAPESRDSARVFTVADTRRLRVRVDVDETDIARVTVGQRAWVTADAFGDRRFEGTVVRVGGLLGRKNIRTDEPSEKVDTKVLETLIELGREVRLPVGLRVDAFIGT
jgi:multidrug resistance efflux pump